MRAQRAHKTEAPDIFESATFSYRIRLPSSESDSESGYFWIRNFFFSDTATVQRLFPFGYGYRPTNPTANPDIFESATFSFRIPLPSSESDSESGYFWVRNFFFSGTAIVQRIRRRIRRIQRHRIRIFLNPLSRVEKNKSATNPITCGRVNPDIFESDDEAKWCPISYRTINQYGGTTCK